MKVRIRSAVILQLLAFTGVSHAADLAPLPVSQQDFDRLPPAQQISIRNRCDMSLTIALANFSREVGSPMAVKALWWRNTNLNTERVQSISKSDFDAIKSSIVSSKDIFDIIHALPPAEMHRIVMDDLRACASIDAN